MTHAVRRTRWRPRVVATAAAVTLLALAGTTSALWTGRASLAGLLHTGDVHFAVGDAVAGGPLPPTATSTWLLPTSGLGTPSDPIAPGESAAAVVQLDAVAQGHRGLAARLASVEIADPRGSGYLADHLDLTLTPVAAPADCTTATPPTSPWYTGPLRDAASTTHELVSVADESTSRAHPAITYLCAIVSLNQPLPDSIVNTATVTGSAGDGLGDPVSATDSWRTELTLPDGATSPSVTFSFTHQTYREEPES